jgi:hypothetical protein
MSAHAEFGEPQAGSRRITGFCGRYHMSNVRHATAAIKLAVSGFIQSDLPVFIMSATAAWGGRHSRHAGAIVKYLPPFDLIRRFVEISTVRGELRVSLSYDDFIKILRTMISGIEVDEDWYLRQYEDIARAVRDGTIASAQQHFIDDGYFEGRLPFPMPVNERWYFEQYPDVAESMRNGVVSSGQQHFAEDGYREGRLPYAL